MSYPHIPIFVTPAEAGVYRTSHPGLQAEIKKMDPQVVMGSNKFMNNVTPAEAGVYRKAITKLMFYMDSRLRGNDKEWPPRAL